jgi:hypothetical protein
MGGCVVGNSDYPCSDPGRTYMIGCVHEHAGLREICDRHAELMRGHTYCVQCAKGDSSHECEVFLHQTNAEMCAEWSSVTITER